MKSNETFLKTCYGADEANTYAAKFRDIVMAKRGSASSEVRKRANKITVGTRRTGWDNALQCEVYDIISTEG